MNPPSRLNRAILATGTFGPVDKRSGEHRGIDEAVL